MFPSIVSHLSITPQAVNQLVFYGRRLAQEDITRKLSAFFAVLLVALQFAVILAPPTASNAASPNDVISGGFTDKADFLSIYDNRPNLRALLDYFGISRADVKASKEGEINSKDHSLLSLGRDPHSGDVKTIKCCGDTFYLRPLYVWDTTAYTKANGSTYKALIGTRASDGGFFALMNACGNIVIRKLPTVQQTPTPTPVPSSFACSRLSATPTSGKAPLTVNFTATATAKNDKITQYVWDFGDGKTTSTESSKVSHTYAKDGKYTAQLRVRDADGKLSPAITACSVGIGVDTPPPVVVETTPPNIVQQKSAVNLTQLTNGQPTDATTVTAQPGDSIRYTLTTSNTGGSTEPNYLVQDDLTDILEYATVTDPGGGTMSTDTNGSQVISWPAAYIPAGATVIKQFVVQVKNPVPATAQGVSDPDSFDLKMDNVYGNGITIPVAPPPIKVVAEGTSQNLPQTGAGTDALVVFVFAALIMYFWARNRQLMTEVKILRTDYQGGAI